MTMRCRKQMGVLLVGILCVALLAGCGTGGETSQTPGTSATSGSTAPAGTTEAPNTTTKAPSTTTEAPSTTTQAPSTTTQSEPAPTEPTSAPSDGTVGGEIAALARTLIGKPFVYGEAGPDSFDNSGFVHYCFAQKGITVPRTTGVMFSGGTAVEKADLQPGDLVFYSVSETGRAEYVGIYVGDGQFIACSNENRPVDVMNMAWKDFEETYVGARRYR